MKKLYTLILLTRYLILPGQYATYYGDDMSPIETIHVLSIFINIDYDLCPTCDPMHGTNPVNWLPGTPNTINTSPPVYLANYMDREYDPNNIQGTLTKFWADASFNRFIVIGDFISVDISKSRITPGDPTGPFSEYQLLDSSIALINTLNWKTSGITEAIVKKQGGVITNKLHSLGDNGDPFIERGGSMSISSNPAPVNVITYHYNQGSDGAINKSSRIDNRKIHLTGLSISTRDNGDGTIWVNIDWNWYSVRSNVRWVGDILLHERIDLAVGNKITFDQNQTPDIHMRDSRTGLFSGPTYFTCLGNSEFKMYHDSEVELKSQSSFLTNSSSTLRIEDNADFIVKQGTTLVLKAGSNLVISGEGNLKVETGGCLCIENGANITLTDASSRIHLLPDATNGVNTTVLTGSYDCRYNLVTTPYSGSGAIVVDINSQDSYIQNETITNTRTYNKRDVYFGEKVTTTKSFGLVKINSGANVTVNASRDILLDNGFEAALGSELTLQ